MGAVHGRKAGAAASARFAIAVVATAVACSGCFLLPKEEAELKPPLMKVPDITYDTVTAERTSIVDKISGIADFRYVTERPAVFTGRGGTLGTMLVTYGDKVQAGQKLATLSTGSLDLDIKLQELEVRKTQLALDKQKAMSADKFALESAQIDLDSASLRLDYLKRQMTEATLFAPISGVVTYVTQASIGDSVQAYQTIVTVSDPSRVGLIYDGPRYNEFHLGDEVDVSYHNQKYAARVSRSPAEVPYDAPDSERQRILIDFVGRAPDASIGDVASIDLVLSRKDNVIVIPRNLVQTFLGSRIVYVLKNGLKQERLVEVGIETSTEAEIVKGLDAGEKVITR